MADFRADDEIVTEFLLNTCRVHQWMNDGAINAMSLSNEMATVLRPFHDETELIPVITGSVAEFYIEPLLSCVGDVDVMYYHSNQLAIPAGTAPPTQLPNEFDSHVWVFEIVDSEFPGYVYLLSYYLLAECIDDGKYNAVQCALQYALYDRHDKTHGPAFTTESSHIPCHLYTRLAGSRYFRDSVYCFRCFSWPRQAADWPTRHRNYG